MSNMASPGTITPAPKVMTFTISVDLFLLIKSMPTIIEKRFLEK